MDANTTTSTGGAFAHRTGLQPVGTDPYIGGFANIFKKEVLKWFRPRKLITQAVIWLAIINGLMAFVLFVVPYLPSESGQPVPEMDPFVVGLTLFFSMAFQAGAVGAIISAQDAIVGEKQTGTAAWILSKPVTRFAFVLAKLVATGVGLLVITVGLTSAVAYVEVALAAGKTFDLLPYLGGAGLVALGLLYFLSLTIMLGTMFDQRGPVVGITLGLLFGGIMLVSLLPQVALATPLRIHTIAAALATGADLPSNWALSVASTVLSTLLFGGIAMWKFNKEEF
jgi:ABC-2 type transport system permease protein